MHLHSHVVGFVSKKAELSAARRLCQLLAEAGDSEGQLTAFP